MKKLMIAATIVCAAAFANAYQIQWGAAMIGVPQATDPKVSQTGITTPMAGTAGYVPFGAGELTMTLYWVSTAGNVKINDYALTTAGGIANQNLGDGTESDLYKAMVADHGTSWKPQYVVTATYETADGVYTFHGTAASTKALSAIGTGNVGASLLGSTGTWDYVAGSTPVIPEPTSGLLLLLGVAGLALRRKQK